MLTRIDPPSPELPRAVSAAPAAGFGVAAVAAGAAAEEGAVAAAGSGDNGSIDSVHSPMAHSNTCSIAARSASVRSSICQESTQTSGSNSVSVGTLLASARVTSVPSAASSRIMRSGSLPCSIICWPGARLMRQPRTWTAPGAAVAGAAVAGDDAGAAAAGTTPAAAAGLATMTCSSACNPAASAGSAGCLRWVAASISRSTSTERNSTSTVPDCTWR